MALLGVDGEVWDVDAGFVEVASEITDSKE